MRRMATEEVEQEVEAMEAVYGSDCTVFRVFPPHLSIGLKPRTADNSSLQFVEAVLTIRAGDSYPEVAPELELKDTKGLDDRRHADLLKDLHLQAAQLSGEPMLLSICEAATDLLTTMNVPEGDCCFCMNPLAMDDAAQPFMKLMSCFHCFHIDCFGSWWRWLQHETLNGDDTGNCEDSTGSLATTQDLLVHCPICRVIINAEDVAHVREYLTEEHELQSFPRIQDTQVPLGFMTEVAELARRANFRAEFEAQQARGGIIEVKKLEVIQPGMILPPRTPPEEEAPPSVDGGDSFLPSSNPSSESPTTSDSQAPGRQQEGSRTGQGHRHSGSRLDSCQGERSQRGRMGGRFDRGKMGGRSWRGRRGGVDAAAGRGRSGRSRMDVDIATSEHSRMQLQDSRRFEVGIVQESSGT